MAWWLLHVLGMDDISGRWYAFWSGFGSDLAYVTAAAGVIWTFWRKHNCHVHRCWRIGRHSAGEHIVCGHHHPTGAPSHADVLAAHRGERNG